MSELLQENLNDVQQASFALVKSAIEYSRKMRGIIAPRGVNDPQYIADYCRIGITLPQRSGVTVFSQFLADYLLATYPDDRILRMAAEEQAYGDAIDPRIDFLYCKEQTDYGRARQVIRRSDVNYSFIIVDQSEWICGRDTRFEGLCSDMFREQLPHQFLINLST